MFGKDDQQRIGDTLTLIENAPGLNPLVRKQISMWAAGLYPRDSSVERQTYRALSRNMSVAAKIAPGVAKGDQQQRGKRRAIVLLWKAIGKKQNVGFDTDARAAAAMTMPPTGLDAALSDVMLKAAVVASPGGALEVMQILEVHPVQFLRRHRLQVNGTSNGSVRFSSQPNGNYQNVLTFNFQYSAGGIEQFVMGRDNIATYGAAHSFSTVSVPAVHWSQVPAAGAAPCNFGGVLGCEVTGANFMLTTQFSGCAFGWTSYGGLLRAFHISPFGGAPQGGPFGYPGGGNALAQQLVANGLMANAGNTALTVFGAGAGNVALIGAHPFYPNPVTGWVTIIGLRKGGGAWRFYVQVVDAVGNIVEARRIL